MRIILALGALLAVLACSHGFLLGSVGHARAKRASRTVVSMGIWDAIKAGFENEQIDTPPPSAGLKNGPQTVKITFLPSKKVVEAVAGQKLSDVVSAARIPVKFDCRKGQCGTCEVVLNGKKVRTCVSIVPRNVKEVKISV